MQREAVNSLYAGQQGSGKTFAVNFHTRRYSRLVAYDQSGFLDENGPSRFDRFNGIVTRDAKEFAAQLSEAVDLDVGYRLALIDEQAKNKDWWEGTVHKLTASPGKGARPKHPVGVWVEEAALVYNQLDAPEKHHPKMMEMLRATRHRRLHLIFSTQRIQDLHKRMRDLLTDVWVFQHLDHDLAESAARQLGDRRLIENVRNLDNGRFFHRDPTGKLTGPSRIRVDRPAASRA